MFCDRCGTEIKDDAKFCHKCGNPISINEESVNIEQPIEEPKTVQNEETLSQNEKTEETINIQNDEPKENNNNNNTNTNTNTAENANSAEPKKKGGKMMFVIILLGIMVVGYAIISSPFAKYTMASHQAELNDFAEAYNTIASLEGEKAEAKRKYYLFRQDLYNITKGAPETDLFDSETFDFDGTRAGTDGLDWDIDMFNDMRLHLDAIESNSRYFSEKELQAIENGRQAVEEYDNSYEDISNFDYYLNQAHKIYDITKYLDSGEYFSPEKELAAAEECGAALDEAQSIYTKYNSYDIEKFYRYSRILSAVDFVKDCMNKSIDKYGKGRDNIYYPDGFSYTESPYENQSYDINDVVDDFRLKVIKYCVEKNGF